jgi:hypothetical protein
VEAGRGGKTAPVDPTRLLAGALAVNRVLFGANYLARPASAGPTWIGRTTARLPGSQVMIRSQAARDIGLGLGALAALARGRDGEAGVWMAAHAVADGVDVAATWAARKRLPNGGTTALAIAGASTAVAVLGAVRLGTRAAPAGGSADS